MHMPHSENLDTISSQFGHGHWEEWVSELSTCVDVTTGIAIGLSGNKTEIILG